MTDVPKDGLLLGKNTPVVDEYSPGLLFPIPRSQARDSLFGKQPLPFHGVDIWHAYELSWLNDAGVPQVRVGRFAIPATSPNLVESKSFNYLFKPFNPVLLQARIKAGIERKRWHDREELYRCLPHCIIPN